MVKGNGNVTFVSSFCNNFFVKFQSEEVIKNAPPKGQANLQVINALDCSVSLTIGNKKVTVTSYGHSTEMELAAATNLTAMMSTPSPNCYNLSGRTFENNLNLQEKQWFNLVIGEYRNQMVSHTVKQNVTLPPPGKARLCTVILPLSSSDSAFDISLDKDRIQEDGLVLGESNCFVVSADHYKLTVKGKNSSTTYVSSDIVVQNGGIYTAVIHKTQTGSAANVTLFEDLEAYSVSMLYQIPQYFVITSGEILFSITGGLDFPALISYVLMECTI